MRRLPILLFVINCIVMWFVIGIHQGGDTPFYFAGAKTLLEGAPLTGTAIAYAGYMVFVAIHQFFGLGDLGIILSQVALGVLVTVALYDLGCRLAGESAGIIAASLYAVNADLARYHFYILSDSVFTSTLLLTAYAAYRASTSSRSWLVLAGLLSVALAFLRINGWLMMPAFLIFLVFMNAPRLRLKFWAASGVIVVVAAAGLVQTISLSGNRGGGIDRLLVQGEVVWGDPSSKIPMPPVGGLSGEGLSDAPRYCVRHLTSCVRLMGSRVLVALAHIRPSYPTMRNLAVVLSFPILYLLAAIGFFSRMPLPFTQLSLSLIALQLSMVGLIGADWSGRFLLTVVPLFSLYGGIGAVVLMGRWTPGLLKLLEGEANGLGMGKSLTPVR